MMTNRFHIIIIILWITALSVLSAQEVDVEHFGERLKEKLKQEPLSISGSLSGSASYIDGTERGASQPLIYYITGAMTVGLYDWSIPITYRYTNQGSMLDYQIPFKFNRLSLHPKYRWIQAHIGDVSMSFSPYTLSGWQFTGGGIELNPTTFPLQVAVMGGQLQRSVEYDGNPQTIPAFERWGYGGKVQHKGQAYELGLIGFFAKDKAGSLQLPIPEGKHISAMQNAVYSAFGKINPLYFVELFGEYALSQLSYIGDATNTYHAYNAGLNFLFSKGSIGLKYEYIDPDYRTLGAYYFVNDLENITLNGSLTFLSDRVNLSASIGKQHDNLKRRKVQQANQWVGSANIAVKASDRLQVTANYSNFTMYTNQALDPFERLNNPQLYPQLQDSINYRQVSQNVGVITSYNFSERQDISITYNLNDVVNREDNNPNANTTTRFHNAGVNYHYRFLESKLTISPSFNYSNNYLSNSTTNIYGPSLNISKLFFEDKLNTTLGGNYNYSQSNDNSSENTHIRLTINFLPYKNHQLSATAIQTFRTQKSATSNQEAQRFDLSLGYTYTFEKHTIPLPKFRRKISDTPEEESPLPPPEEPNEPIEEQKEAPNSNEEPLNTGLQ